MSFITIMNIGAYTFHFTTCIVRDILDVCATYMILDALVVCDPILGCDTILGGHGTILGAWPILGA